MENIIKYPRTLHLQGSSLQKGDDDHNQIPYADLKDCYIVVEEKMDGANSGVRFTENGELRLQSRGHYLVGGGREKHFSLLKTWAATHEKHLFELLGSRYVMYGEWMFAKHTVFYDQLPHYFLEFDIWDTHENCFLSTSARQSLLQQKTASPVVSVPILYKGIAPRHLKDLLSLIQTSLAKSNEWKNRLSQIAQQHHLNIEQILAQTEDSQLSEGLYIKIENEDQTIGRYKWVRADFLQTISENNDHWLSRPIIPNQLSPNVDIYSSNFTLSKN